MQVRNRLIIQLRTIRISSIKGETETTGIEIIADADNSETIVEFNVR